jgi:DNA-directed RNA polymerase specialized sigma24 family protein
MELWAQASEALLTYFQNRCQNDDAGDLVQQTLLTLWSREDYKFETPEDFLRVAHGFAKNIWLAYLRRKGRNYESMDEAYAAPDPSSAGMRGAEVKIFLREVRAVAQTQLKRDNWNLIRKAAAAQMEGRDYDYPRNDANKLRVQLHRARKRLAQIVGARKPRGVMPDG